MSENFVLGDRIKQLTTTVGTGNIVFSETAVNGFSPFSYHYNYNDKLYYAITDGVDYEIGYGEFLQLGSNDGLSRSPFASSNNNELVNFGNGLKEVFATYPGKFSVFTASGVPSYNEPLQSGVAFWQSKNVIDYDSNILWDSNNKLLNVYGIKFGDGSVQTSSATEPSDSYKTYVNISANYNVLTTDEIIFVNSTANTINVYIHTAVNFGGKQLTIKRSSGSNLVYVHANGSETIDGQSTRTMFSLYESLTITSNNSHWFIN
jgi:hypothetical protein